MPDFLTLREQMVRRQIATRGISNPLVLDAFREVPREVFVDEDRRSSAYDDHPLPIGAGQTISQPYIVAFMIESAEIAPGDTVLEVGAGSGYAAAVISRIAGSVTAIERHCDLAEAARVRLHRLAYDNVRIVEGDGTLARLEEAPFDAILASASGSHIPDVLVEQLAPGGRLVMPLGEPNGVQELVKLTKRFDGTTVEERLAEVRFVPLIGGAGWREG